jgi:hypothetical protein
VGPTGERDRHTQENIVTHIPEERQFDVESKHFDELTKRLYTTRVTRMTALRGLVAGAAAAVAGVSLLSDDAEAKKHGGGGGGKGKKGKKHSRSAKGGNSGGSNAGGGNATCPTDSLYPTNSARIDAEQLFLDPTTGQLVAGCKLLDPISVPAGNGFEACTCYIEACLSDDHNSVYLGTQTTCRVDNLLVKGGSNGVIACFDPQIGEYCSTNVNGGSQFPDVSNVTFCGIHCPETPPPTLHGCLHSTATPEFPDGGCMPACTAKGGACTGARCGVICGTGQSTGACPVGQGFGNPCSSDYYCQTCAYTSSGTGKNATCTFTPPPAGTCAG